MPLFPTRDPTLQQRGLYSYDLEAANAAQGLGAQRERQFQSAPVFGSGGLQGQGLGARADLESAYVARLQEVQRRRRMMEQQRLGQEADIRERRMAQTNQMNAQNIKNFAVGTGGLIMQGVRQGTSGESFQDPYWAMGDRS